MVGLASAVAIVPAMAQDTPKPQADPWHVYLILENHCAECHGGHRTKPKGDFGYVLDLKRLISEAYVRPGSPRFSQLYTAMISTDPDEHMPPLDSDATQPTEADIQVIHDWIAAGAPVDPADQETNAGAPKEEAKPALSPGRVVGRLHPLLVHFPIGLLIAACVAQILAFCIPKALWPQGMVRGCLWGGALGAIVAAVAGWMDAHFDGFVGADVTTHRWFGVATACVATAALVLHEWLTRNPRHRRLLQLILLGTVALLVVITGHTGGRIAYGDDYFWGF